MGRKILVVADLRNGQVRNVTLEMLTAASELAAGEEVHAVLIGQGVAHHADLLAQYGAEKVFVVEDEALAYYIPDGYAKALETVIQQSNPDVVFLAHSAIGRDLAPKLAARLNVGQVSDIIAVEAQGEELIFTRPIYAGKAFTKVAAKGKPLFATVRANNLSKGEADAGKKAQVVPVAVDLAADSLRTLVREVVRKSVQGVDLSEAKIVVSGGRGVKSAEGFQVLYELANVLGAAVGASRGACDAGYCDYALQIGQTGKVVTPDLYIACGISGAIQHLAGMSNSKVIVAINKDPEAPIFQVADYGIVGDLFRVVPLLTEELKKALVVS